MTQKILHSLHKIFPQDRWVWGAFAAAIGVHVLLLLLFGITPAQSPQDAGELPKVGTIVLSDPNNAELAVWMKNHDPAIMTVPDRVLGYSAVLGSGKQRGEPEDLPNLVQPVIPQKKLPVRPIGKLKISGRGVLHESNVPQIYKAAAILPAVTLNGEYSAEIHKILTATLKENAGKLPVNWNKVSDTAFEFQPERLPGTGARVILTSGSGSDLLDDTARKTLHKYMLTRELPEKFYGRVIFIWGNIKSIPENNRKQAI